ncbi:phage Gp37/Gp68 family protein [Pseudomonas syringae]|uniref:phage Gp37/Gp68 family protein n=1 Tax=Pseudomonas syringae TaxID=317 RepID=UPI002463D741|nr:phage Gp37/Gp68 family protein [Pseudomonas syringae]MDH4602408.1 phage Gp37/Gp68 family protein [Pseudomonas syringae pv. papulans]
MSQQTKIEWCDSTFNPWIGCTKVSPACDDCYAARSTPARALGVTWGPGQPRRRTSASNWKLPLKWNASASSFHAEHGRRQRVFCASLADVFDNDVPADWRDELWQLIAATPNLDWLLLTKRIGNVKQMLPDEEDFDVEFPNVWIGATICNQAEADRDIPKLLATPARVRFLSIEPLIGPVNLHLKRDPTDLKDLHWVIVGGESGFSARPMSPDWARLLRDQCARSGIAFHFKQWGEWLPMLGQAQGVAVRPGKVTTADGWVMGWAGKKAAGRKLDGQIHGAFPVASHVPKTVDMESCTRAYNRPLSAHSQVNFSPVLGKSGDQP